MHRSTYRPALTRRPVGRSHVRAAWMRPYTLNVCRLSASAQHGAPRREGHLMRIHATAVYTIRDGATVHRMPINLAHARRSGLDDGEAARRIVAIAHRSPTTTLVADVCLLDLILDEPAACAGSGRPVGAASRCETCGVSFGFPHPAGLVVGRPAPLHEAPEPDGIDHAAEDAYRAHSSSITGVFEASE